MKSEDKKEPTPTPTPEVVSVRPPGAFRTQDLLAALVTVLLILSGALLYRALAEPALLKENLAGIDLERPAAWLPFRAVPVAPEPLALTIDGESQQRPARRTIHLISQSPIASVDRIELRVEPRPVYKNWRGVLSLFRVGRYGDTYWTAQSAQVGINGREWVRTEFRYAYVAYAGDSPKLATGIEYATLVSNMLYVVTFHGDRKSAHVLSELVRPTLVVNAEAAAQRFRESQSSERAPR
jgi:hypothetical protein